MSAFDLLHPALQHHIVNSLGWSSLRPLQEKAIPPLVRGDHTLLVAPTAGGKTEAAFFPVLSRMLAERWTGLSVLYVCPLRALLNNLHPRLEHYGRLVGRNVGLWHGDTAGAIRRDILLEPPDCLLTTPESIEVMLVTRREHHAHLFGQLQAVVVDEIHAFAGDDRGWHLLALLERLSVVAGHPLQRIGLSATVGNPEQLLEWLAGSAPGTRTIVVPEPGGGAEVDLTIDAVGSLQNAAHVISRLHHGEKRLVFCDSRAKVEDLASQLRRLDVRTFVSHSSLSLDERRMAEEAFSQGSDCVIVATSTLELGIDVGDLDRVIQIDAPVAVASFLQRLGRTGRREGAVRNYLFLTTTSESLMQAAALVRLWMLGHVERVQPPPAPFHILAQQIMALALQEGGVARTDWRAGVGGMPAFRSMDEALVDRVIQYMLDTGVMFDDGGVLGIGRRGEEEYGRRHFMEIFSAFVSEPLFAVRFGDRHISSVHITTFARWPDGDVILVLGGRSWRVTHVDWPHRLAYVELSQEQGRSRWAGTGQPIRYELCQAMRDVLLGCALSAHVSKRAAEAFKELRKDFTWLESGKTSLVQDPKGHLRWWTFGGLHANAGIAAKLKRIHGLAVSPSNLALRLGSYASIAAVTQAIDEVRQSPVEELVPDITDKALEGLKFVACVPKELATQLLQIRMMDVVAAEHVLAEPTISVANTQESS
ncbi:MAG: DEAD/DEAH box helicase [Vicinamibacteraceae bacterium]